jgi:hypothetical protein
MSAVDLDTVLAAITAALNADTQPRVQQGLKAFISELEKERERAVEITSTREKSLFVMYAKKSPGCEEVLGVWNRFEEVKGATEVMGLCVDAMTALLQTSIALGK